MKYWPSLALALLSLAACGSGGTSRGGPGGAAGPDAGSGTSGGSGDPTDANSSNSYVVYAHSNTTLYSIDLATNALVTVGSFNTPDVITDLAVAPNGTIYVISEHNLFTASAVDGHVTRLGTLATCGQRGVALTTTSDGRVWIGDYLGAICELDISQSPPVVKPPVMMSDGLALAGDMVGIGDGSVYGTAYKLADTATEDNNILVKLDVTTGIATQIGASGYPRLYGAAFQENKVFGFTHDGSGRVVTIDLANGAGTMFGTFLDPATSMGIAFAGAGVNSLVVIE